MVPAPFQARGTLAWLNIAAVGVSLAAVVSAVLGALLPDAGRTALASGIPTLIVGTLWAWVLRWPATVGKSSVRWGWVASVPLAIINAAAAAGLLLSSSFGSTAFDPPGFLIGAVLGATAGAFIWLPALVATLVCFGLPIAWAQHLAKKGLAGEERGEWIVGFVCVAMSLAGLLVSLGDRAQAASLGFTPYEAARIARMFHGSSLGLVLPRVLAAAGVLVGLTSALLALSREGRRRRFVRDAEAGEIPGYRVDLTHEGKVLVRVGPQGRGYRVADFEEELFELDAEGEATRPKRVATGNDG